MGFENQYEEGIQEQIRLQRRRERALQSRKKRRLKRRMRWVFTRIVPFCLVCLLLLGGIVFGIRGIVMTVLDHTSGDGKQAKAPAETVSASEETADANIAKDQIIVGEDAAGDAVTAEPDAMQADAAQTDAAQTDLSQADEEGTLGGNDEQLEEGEKLDEVPSDIVEVPSGDYYAEETGHTVDFAPDVLAARGILIDPKTHTIIASRGGKNKMVPASMTKVLTLLVAVEHIKDLNDTFTITAEIGDYAKKHDLSIVGFREGEVVTVKDLLYGTILPSGGDAAMALATYVAGSEENFVELMNQKLITLGLSETSHMTNCVGIFDEDHYSTCYDIAMIMQAALDNELCRKILTERKYMTASTEQNPQGIEISNWFLRRIEDKDCGGTVMYAKTGYVKESGYCAVSYAISADGDPLILVTQDSGSSWKCIYDHVRIYSAFFSVAG